MKEIGGIPIAAEGKVKVALTIGEPPLSQRHYVVFLVVKLPLSFNVILRRPMLYDFKVMMSIQYLSMKFPTSGGVSVVQGRQEEARAVYWAMVDEQNTQQKEINPEVMEVQDERKEGRTKPVDKLETFPLSELENDKIFSINPSLEQSQKEAAMALIRGHASSFAWKPSDMPRIKPVVMTYKLNVFPDAKPVKHKNRVFGKEKQSPELSCFDSLTRIGSLRTIFRAVGVLEEAKVLGGIDVLKAAE